MRSRSVFVRFFVLFAFVAAPLTQARAAPPTYSEVRAKVFATSCLDCHNPQPRVRFQDYEMTIRWLPDIQRVVFGDHSMPPTPYPITQPQLQLLKAWIDAGAPDDQGHPAPPLVPYPGDLEPNYRSIKWYVLDAKCMECHEQKPLSNDVPLGDYSAIMNPALGLVVPGSTAQSQLYQAIDRNGSVEAMPPDSADMPWVTPEENIVIQEWIENGAPY